MYSEKIDQLVVYSRESRTSKTMYSKRVCTNCGKELQPSQPYVRCCDADVCSERCSKERMLLIASVDPNLTSPMSWPGTQSLTLHDCHLKKLPTRSPPQGMRRTASSSQIMYPILDENDEPDSPLIISTRSDPSAPTPPQGNVNKIVICILGCLGLALMAIAFA